VPETGEDSLFADLKGHVVGKRIGNGCIDDVLDGKCGRPAPRAPLAIGDQLAAVATAAPSSAEPVFDDQGHHPLRAQRVKGGGKPDHRTCSLCGTVVQLCGQRDLVTAHRLADDVVRGLYQLCQPTGDRERNPSGDELGHAFGEVCHDLVDSLG